MSPEGLQFLSLPGLTPYDEAHALQRELVEKRIRDEIADTVIFVEHPTVVTRGRGLQFESRAGREAQLPMAPLPANVAYFEIERGGDLTLHNPGQLVIYPIFKLEGRHAWAPSRDIGLFLRNFEDSAMAALRAGYGIQAQRVAGATGVWVDTPLGARKIASLGVALKRWVTYHGMAVNGVNDLRQFNLISPCGFSPEVMTSIAELRPEYRSVTWRTELEAHLTRAFSAESAASRVRIDAVI